MGALAAYLQEKVYILPEVERAMVIINFNLYELAVKVDFRLDPSLTLPPIPVTLDLWPRLNCNFPRYLETRFKSFSRAILTGTTPTWAPTP